MWTLPTRFPVELGPRKRAMTQTEFAAALGAHLDTLHNLAAWLVRHPADAEALVRATCQQALQQLPQFISGTNLRLQLLSLLWERYAQNHPPGPDGLNERAAESVASDRRGLLHTLTSADLEAGLRQLPAALRAGLILSDMEGYTVGEMGIIFGWSRSRTQLILSTARRRLDAWLRVRMTATATAPAPDAKDSP